MLCMQKRGAPCGAPLLNCFEDSRLRGNDKSRALLQLFQCRFVLRNDVLLRSELGAFGVHDCFGGAADELFVRELAFNRSGECLGLLDLHFVPNACLGHGQINLPAPLGLRICPF